MSFDGKPVRANQSEVKAHLYYGVGTGADELTKTYGPGITTARQSAGCHRFSFADNPGTYMGFTPGLQAATPANLAGHTVIADDYMAPSGTTDGYIELTVYSAADAAHDLVALEYLNVTFWFKTTAVEG